MAGKGWDISSSGKKTASNNDRPLPETTASAVARTAPQPVQPAQQVQPVQPVPIQQPAPVRKVFSPVATQENVTPQNMQKNAARAVAQNPQPTQQQNLQPKPQPAPAVSSVVSTPVSPPAIQPVSPVIVDKLPTPTYVQSQPLPIKRVSPQTQTAAPVQPVQSVDTMVKTPQKLPQKISQKPSDSQRAVECAFARKFGGVLGVTAEKVESCDLECAEKLKTAPQNFRPAACPANLLVKAAGHI
jgi:hypothetical protein